MVINHQALGKNVAQLRLECGCAREIGQGGRNVQILGLLSLFWKQRHLNFGKQAARAFIRNDPQACVLQSWRARRHRITRWPTGSVSAG